MKSILRYDPIRFSPDNSNNTLTCAYATTRVVSATRSHHKLSITRRTIDRVATRSFYRIDIDFNCNEWQRRRFIGVKTK